MAERGYIKLARQSMESDIWHKPPLYWKIWSFILMKANYQDDEKVKRGEFVTTISELQEAGSYYVGYRKVTPSQKQIRKILEYFRSQNSPDYEDLAKGCTKGHTKGHTKVPMVGTTKVTNGILIKVLKYAEFQASENYEGHNEGHNEGAHEGTYEGADEGAREGTTYPYKEYKERRIKNKEGIVLQPTLDQIREYVYTENLMVDPDRFFDYYESQGWKLSNGNKMKDWKASCRNWHRKEVEKMNKQKKGVLPF